MMKMIDKNINFASLFRGGSAAVLLLTLICASQAAFTKDVSSPYVEKGELELEWKGGITHDDNDEDDGAWAQKASIGYGFTERLFLEIEGEIENAGDSDDTDFAAVALEGKVQLTEPGEYWADVGLKGEYEVNLQDGADKIEAKLLLAKETGQFSHLANIKLEREIGEDSEDETEAGFAWSTRYRYTPSFEPGFEIHSDFGSLSHSGNFDDQGHQIGPVLYGQLGPIGYDVGYLVGVSDSAPDGLLKAVLEYETHF